MGRPKGSRNKNAWGFKPAKRQPGNITKEERLDRIRLAAEKVKEAREDRSHGGRGLLPLLGPPAPPGIGGNWGGRRAGAGRPKAILKGLELTIRLPTETAQRIAKLETKVLDKYIAQAVELMADIMPPEKFRVQPVKGEDDAHAVASDGNDGVTAK